MPQRPREFLNDARVLFLIRINFFSKNPTDATDSSVLLLSNDLLGKLSGPMSYLIGFNK